MVYPHLYFQIGCEDCRVNCLQLNYYDYKKLQMLDYSLCTYTDNNYLLIDME